MAKKSKNEKKEKKSKKAEKTEKVEKRENGEKGEEKGRMEKPDSEIIDMPEEIDTSEKRRSSIEKIETFFGKLLERIINSNVPANEILNYMLVGYLTGLAITILWFNYVSTYELDTSQWLFWNGFVIICLLLARSTGVRCTVALAVPMLTTSRGRSVIMAGAFFLGAMGPTANTFKNINIMSESLICGQMELKKALSDIVDAIKKPLVAIKEAIRAAIRELKNVLKRVEQVLKRIKKLVLSLLMSIKMAFAWLRDIVSICNKEFGTPFQRCIQIADDAIQDCRQKLGAFSDVCEVTNVFRWLCYTAKVVDVICVLVDFLSDAIIGTIMRKLEEFVDQVKNMFDVSITFDHDFYFKTTSSRELKQIRDDIMNDIKQRMRSFLLIFGWLDILSFILMFLVLIKAVYFRMKYLHNPGYQNNYITTEFLQIDKRRRSHGQETVLPLKYYETLKYPRLNACLLTKMEWIKMSMSAVFLHVSTIQLFFICATDYCLFWVLALISFYGLRQKGFEPPPYITVHVNGNGFVADIFRGVVGAFEPLSQNYTIDAKTCLPLPSEPNINYYYYIMSLCLLAWLFLLCEPYGLRLRHVVMRLYYPDIAKKRAVWLYNKILLNRMTFMKLARRKARLLFIKDEKTDDFSCMDWIRATADNYYIGRLICGTSKTEKCILCGIPLKGDNRVQCQTIGCNALYCKTCYAESQNICCICTQPLTYGDLSDESNLEDSSDDPNAIHIDEYDEYCPNAITYEKSAKLEEKRENISS